MRFPTACTAVRAWIAFSLALPLMAAVERTSAQAASDAEMASDTLVGYASRDPVRREKMFADQREKIVMLAQDATGQLPAGTVFFRTGLSVNELQDLASALGFEVMAVTLKAPFGSDGRIMSMGMSLSDLAPVKGSLAEKLSFAIEMEQKCFRMSSEIEQDDDTDAWADLAVGQFLVYSAQVFGPAGALAQLQQQPRVTGILLNPGQVAIAEFEAAQSSDRTHRYFVDGFHC